MRDDLFIPPLGSPPSIFPFPPPLISTFRFLEGEGVRINSRCSKAGTFVWKARILSEVVRRQVENRIRL